jgi:hypothetical protein
MTALDQNLSSLTMCIFYRGVDRLATDVSEPADPKRAFG